MKLKNNLVLCGFMGCGKTTVGRALSQSLGVPFIDTDEFLKEKLKLDIPEIFSKYGESFFRTCESSIIRQVTTINGAIISLGGGSLNNTENVNKIKENGRLFFIDTHLSEIKKRLKNDTSRPILHKENVNLLFASRYRIYKRHSDYTVNGNSTCNAICKDIIKKINLCK